MPKGWSAVGLLAIHGQKEYSRYRGHVRLQRQKINNKRRVVWLSRRVLWQLYFKNARGVGAQASQNFLVFEFALKFLVICNLAHCFQKVLLTTSMRNKTTNTKRWDALTSIT